jgi:predicted transcriptional regulator
MDKTLVEMAAEIVQALVSKDLSAKIRKVAKEKGLGQKLAKARKKRAKA